MKNKIYFRTRILAISALIVFLLASLSLAATYYVDATNGKDANSGLSQATAWKTIAKVNSSKFLAGDQILFKRGEIWREMLFVPSSGSPTSPITFSTYGVGSNPVITGADLMATGTSWSLDGGNIWKAMNISTEPKVVIMNGRVGNKQTSKTDCVAEYDWFWSMNTLYIFSPGDPSIAYTSPGIEIGQRLYCLSWHTKSCLTFQNIDFVAGNIYNIFMDGYTSNILFDSCGIYKAYQQGISHNSVGYDASYITIQNCIVAYNGGVGILLNGRTDHWTIQNNTVRNNGYTNEEGDAENRWGAGIKLVGLRGGPNCKNHIIQRNEVFYNGYKDNGITRVNLLPNKGFGIWADLTDAYDIPADGNVIRFNNVHHNADSGLFVEKSRYCSVYYNLSYNNGEYGLRVDADENGPAVQDNFFFNNILFGNVAGLYVAGGYTQDNNYVKNNVFKNNISAGNSIRQLICKWGAENDGFRGSGNIYEYNCLGPQYDSFIEWGTNNFKSTYASWEETYSKTTYSINADPLFRDPSNSQFTLQQTSPCIDAGTAVGLTQDLEGNPVPQGSGVDIGAFENGIRGPLPPKNLRLISSR